jgi:hypothetical protein
MTPRESVREEILSSALRGLLEVCEEYAPVEPGPGCMRYLPGNGGPGHSIERELRIARESLTEPVAPPEEDSKWDVDRDVLVASLAETLKLPEDYLAPIVVTALLTAAEGASHSASSDTGGATDPEWWDEAAMAAKGAEVAAEEARDEALIARVLERFRPSEAWWDMGDGERQGVNWHEVVGIILAYAGALPVAATSPQQPVPDSGEDCPECGGEMGCDVCRRATHTVVVCFSGGPLDETGGVADFSRGPIHLDLPWERGSYICTGMEGDGDGGWLNYEWRPLAEGEAFPEEPEQALVVLTDPTRELRRVWRGAVTALIERAQEGIDADAEDLERLRDGVALDEQPDPPGEVLGREGDDRG